jgi:hypothetical protein
MPGKKKTPGTSHVVETATADTMKGSPSGPNGAEVSKAKSMESWIWDAACSIRGAQDAPKYKTSSFH